MLQKAIDDTVGRRGTLNRDFVATGQTGSKSSDSWGIVDITRSCPLHATLHRFLTCGVQQVRNRHVAVTNREFQLSIRPSRGVNKLDGTAQ